MSQFLHKEQDADNIECSVSVRLWSIPGCHELLASLGIVFSCGCICLHYWNIKIKLTTLNITVYEKYFYLTVCAESFQ